MNRAALSILLLALCTPALPALASEFVYQGQLDDRGAPANGRYDLRVAVFGDAQSAGTLMAPLTFSDIEVKDGRFELRFDATLTNAPETWLEIAVRDAGAGEFAALPGRSKAISAPLIGACWSSTGDTGSNPTTNFLGTTDAQPLVLRTANVQSLRIEPSAELYAGSPITANVIAGSRGNAVQAGVRGATIAGGGVPLGDSDPTFTNDDPNFVGDHYGTVGGGFANAAGDYVGTVADRAFATVAGGYVNGAHGYASAVGGGELNFASGMDSTVAGGGLNTASHQYSMVVGGYFNCAGGVRSFAGGTFAKVRVGALSDYAGFGCSTAAASGDDDGDEGSFVWADAEWADFSSSGPNQFLVRAAGGVGINSNNLPAAVDLALTSRSGNADLWMRPDGQPNGINLAAFGDASTAALYIARFDGSSYTDYALWQTDGRLRVFFDNPIKPTSGGWAAPSDVRLKRDIEPLSHSLDRLLALRGVRYAYRSDAPNGYFTPGVHAGFVAQEVEAVFPEWLSRDADGYRMVAPQGFEALAVEALRELRDRALSADAAQAGRIEALERENASLHAALSELAAEQARVIADLRAELHPAAAPEPLANSSRGD